MRKELTRMIAMGAICSLAFGAVSCQKEGGKGKDEAKSYKLELANPADKEIVLNDDDKDPFEIALNTENLTKDQISVEAKDEQTWCDASVKDEKTIRVIPGQNPSEEDQTATFVISATGIEGVSPVEFTVIRRGTSTEYTISIESDLLVEDAYGMLNYNCGPEENTIEITVNTNAAKWYLSYMSFSEEEWFTADKSSGRPGETCRITFKENVSGDTRQQMFIFDVTPESSYSDATFNVKQVPSPATKATIKEFNLENETIGEAYTTGKEIIMPAKKSTFNFYIEADGGIELKWAEPGSNELKDYIDEIGSGKRESKSGIEYYYINTYFDNTTGTATEIKADLVIVPSGKTDELFRFKITQAAE